VARTVVIVIEGAGKVESHRVTSTNNYAAQFLMDRVRARLHALSKSCLVDGKCLAFTVGVHVDGADCDHEIPGVTGHG
jgi:hypothetical protein